MVDEKLRTLADTFQGADRILTGDRLHVRLWDGMADQSVAYTDGETISINRNRFSQADLDEVLSIYGINFHELSHVLFTPRKGTMIVGWVMDNDVQLAFNILEDQRIEPMMLSLFPSVEPWLVSSILQWVLKGGRQETAYLFVRGRRYLSGEIRGALRMAFSRPDLLPEVDRIVDAYRGLVYPDDHMQARPLIADFDAILREVSPSGLDNPNGHGARVVEILIKGRPMGVSAQRDAQSQSDDGEPEDDMKGLLWTPDVADKVAKADLDEVLDREDVRKDIDRLMRSIRDAGSSDVVPPSDWTEISPDPEYVSRLNALHRMLHRLIQQAEPGWVDREEHGRVNPLRWEREHDPESAFDAWNEGVHDLVDMEVVLLADVSGSMGDVEKTLFNSMWALKRSLDRIGASTTVITFSDNSRVLYHREEHAGARIRRWFDGNGTDPTEGLRQAARIMARTSKTQRVLIVLTDGDWYGKTDEDGVTSDMYIQRMRNDGVTTALGYIESGWGNSGQGNAHNCAVYAPLSASSIVPFAQHFVVSALRARLAGRR